MSLMFARALVVLLAALNLCVLGWLYLQPPAQLPPSPQSDEGVAPLVLLGERTSENMEQTARLVAAERRDPVNNPAGVYCARLGPFIAAEQAKTLLTAIAPQVARVQVREEAVKRSRGFWVYLTGYDDRTAALAAARQLSAGGVRDYYVVTAGEQENTISLGVFKDTLNANHRRAEIQALGFYPKVQERSDSGTQYWIEYQSRDGKKLTNKQIPALARVSSRDLACASGN
jgi:hypothetical protein